MSDNLPTIANPPDLTPKEPEPLPDNTPKRKPAYRVKDLGDGTFLYSDGSKRRENGHLASVPSYPGVQERLQPEKMQATMQEMREARLQKTARRTRKYIADEVKKLGVDVKDGSDAIAYATAKLFKEIVLSQDVKANDRRLMLETAARMSDTGLVELRPDEAGGISFNLQLGKDISERVRGLLLARQGQSMPARDMPACEPGVPAGDLPAGDQQVGAEGGAEVIDGELTE